MVLDPDNIDHTVCVMAESALPVIVVSSERKVAEGRPTGTGYTKGDSLSVWTRLSASLAVPMVAKKQADKVRR